MVRARFAGLLAVLSGVTLLLSAREASADRQARSFLAPGLLVTVSGHVDQRILGGLGGELTFMRYPWTPYYGGLGAFAQVESVGFDHVRAAIGAQASFLVFGGELGVFIEGAGKGRATTMGIQVSPFVSIGFFSLGFRMGLPLAAVSSGQKYATNLGLSLSLKWPIPLDGSYIAYRG